MAKAFNVDIKGLKQLQAKFASLPKRVREEVSEELRSTAQNIVGDAKKNFRSQVNTRSGNGYNRIYFNGKDLNFSVFGQAKYAPYLEFGTGKNVRVPSGLESYAAQFKGRGQRKNNIKARPHLFPAFFKYKATAFRNIQRVLNSID
jgi:hypothetical protein